MARRYLLSIDGGGVRGIVPALALARLEEITGRLTRETFSFVAGTSTGCLIGHKYDIGHLLEVLADEFGAAAAWTLNDSPIDLLLTAKRLADAKPWYFVRNNPNNSGATGHLDLIDCATASAAAPTYFDPWPMAHPVDGKLVDGGVRVAGNPVYQASVEAFCYSQ